MIENADWAGIINVEFKESTNRHYLTFKEIKTRFRKSQIKYFAHPFEDDNLMRLLDDINEKKPLSIMSLVEDTASSEDLAKKKGRRKRTDEEPAGEVISVGEDDFDLIDA